MKKNKSENYLDLCIYYKDRELPGMNKTDAFKKALILDSISNKEHAVNQLIQHKPQFVPYINERDKLGKLLSLDKYHRKRKSDGSILQVTPKVSHLLGSKNSISNTCSVIDNHSITSKFRLKNLLGIGNSQENTELFPSLHVSQCDFKASFQFSLQKPRLTLHSRKGSEQVQNQIQSPQLIQDIKYPEYNMIKIPKTPIANRMYQRNFVVEQFRKNKIPKEKEILVVFMEKLFRFQEQLLKGKTCKERRQSIVKIGRKKFKLSLLLLISKQTQFQMLN